MYAVIQNFTLLKIKECEYESERERSLILKKGVSLKMNAMK